MKKVMIAALIAAMTLTACNGRPATVINGRAVNSTNNSGVNGGLSIDNQDDQDSEDSLVSSYNYNGTGTSDGTDAIGSDTDTYTAGSNDSVSGTGSNGSSENSTDINGTNQNGSSTGTQQTAGSGSAATGDTQNGTERKALVGTKVETDYFTVAVPASWSGKYDYETFKMDDGSVEIKFYEHADRASVGGGLVFTLALYPDGVNYSYYPNYRTIGKLSSGSANYTLLAVYPTDIQYTEDNEELYLTMADGTDSIISSISPAENYELTRGGDGYNSQSSGREDSGIEETTVSTPYFNLSIPESWGGKYYCSSIDRNDGGYEIKFYEYADYAESDTGFLFSMIMFPQGTDYTEIPNLTDTGTVTTANGTYNLVVVYPSDVQYSEENEDLYDSMKKDVPSIVNSISENKSSDTELNVDPTPVEDDGESESLEEVNAAAGITADSSEANAVNSTISNSTLQSDVTGTGSADSSSSGTTTTIEPITD